VHHPEAVLKALRRPLDPLPDLSSLPAAELTAIFRLLLYLFRSGNHLLDDLGLGIPGARKQLVATLARAKHRSHGMAASGPLGWSVQGFMLENPSLFDAASLSWLLERNDELCAGNPLVAGDAREYLRGAVRGALVLWHAWDEHSRAVVDGALARSLAV
jgi:hypothetical protein